jgi:glycerol-3-phosphate acyltransferase PlsY
MEFALKVVLAYLLGSINGALLLGRVRGVDIRTQGSGNAGGTNALRTQGPGFALAVIVIDVAKGWLAGAWLPSAGLAVAGFPGAGAACAGPWLVPACALAAILGHVYPVFHGFRGGKGVATLVGAVAAVSPLALVALLATWLFMMLVWGFVGLASIVAACALPLILFAIGAQPQAPLLVFGLLCGALVAYTHRGNLARMRAGTEPRARRLWLLGRLRGQ